MVRDQRTGRAIAGALVVGADGSATRTDDDGRFVLSVRGGEHRSIRASAALHADSIEDFDARDEGALDFDLIPIEAVGGVAPIEDDHPDAVLRWLRESWVDEREHGEGGGEAHAMSDGAPASAFAAGALEGWSSAGWSHDALRSTEDGAFDDPESATDDHAGARACSSCHAAEATLTAISDAAFPAPHTSLAGECQACHVEDLATRRSVEADLPAARCTACHGGAITDRSRIDGLRAARSRAGAAFARAVSGITRCGRVAVDVDRHGDAFVLIDTHGIPLGDCDGSGAIDGSELALGIEILPAPVADAALDLMWLRSDRSSGVHQPRWARAVADRIERSLGTAPAPRSER